MATRRLTSKQRRFAEAWAGNHTAAARAAGYRGSDSTIAALGSRLAKDPRVAAIIEERRRASDLPDVDRDEELADRARGDAEPLLDARAEYTRLAKDPTVSPAVRLRAVEQLSALDRRERPDTSGEARFEALRERVAVEMRAMRERRRRATCPACD